MCIRDSLIGDGGTLIRTAVDDISVQGRDASGVRVMNVNDGHKVAAVARLLASEDEDEDDSDGEELAEGEESAPADALSDADPSGEEE